MTTLTLTIDSPQPYQVVQRRGHDPIRLHAHNPGGPAAGSGLVRIRGHGWPARGDRCRCRAVALPLAFGSGTPWIECSVRSDASGAFSVDVEVPAGGWYRLEVQAGHEGVLADAVVEPVGVGEVFVVAGQSYAVGCHEQVFAIDDAMGRAVAISPEQPQWRVAHDPQPGIESRIDVDTKRALDAILPALGLGYPYGPMRPFRGSVWPVVANFLLGVARVPVAFVHTAVGGTSIEQWRSGTQLFDNLREAVALCGDVRAVLWQQGESDVLQGTPSHVYADALTALRADLCAATGRELPWIVAVSTHHPTAVQDPSAVEAIRAAVHEVWTRPGFVAGPDTDVLAGIGDNRADLDHGSHLTARGQQRAGAMWFSAVWSHLLSPSLDDRVTGRVAGRAVEAREVG